MNVIPFDDDAKKASKWNNHLIKHKSESMLFIEQMSWWLSVSDTHDLDKFVHHVNRCIDYRRKKT